MLRSLINQRLGRYYIKELLGRGGMAAVYRASDTVLQRDVALKVLYPQFGDDESLVLRFQREAVTAAALEHPNIVPVYDVGEHDGMAYIAMKLLSGRTLQDRLQDAGTLALDELLGLLTPVAAALDYAHGKGVVHRDIKPGNIFLSETPDGPRVMLTDFGIAKRLDTPGLTTTGALIGTPDYMAPEQIAGRPVDARTDVYALGMLAYRALTGRRAYEGATQDVLLGHMYNRPAPPSQVNPALPPAVDSVLDRATALEPAGRFASAGALVAALAQAARGEASTAVGVAPALAAPPLPAPPPMRQTAPQPPTGRQAAPPAVLRQGGPRTAAASAAAGETSGATTFAEPPRGAGSAGPWLLAIAFALVAGGLAVALLFTLSRAESAASGPTPAPPAPPTEAPSATPPPPSETPESAAAATATETAATPTETAATPSAEPSASATATTASPPPPPPPATPTRTATTPPSPTPSETAPPSPTPTETPTATPPPEASCDLDLLTGGFGRVYDERIGVRTAIGCPLEREVAGPGSEQFFERGMMLYWDDSNPTPNADYIYVFYGADSGEYDELSPADVSKLGPDPTPGPDPNQPVRGFGRVYFYKPGVSDLLGGSVSPEIELKNVERLAVMQRFEKGMMLYTPIYQPTSGRSIFVLYNDGSFDRFDDTFGG